MGKSYYAIIPASVRYDKTISPNAKLLYGEITALCNERGHCWASNQYFADLYGVGKSTIIRWLNALDQAGYIHREIQYAEDGKTIANRFITIVDGKIATISKTENGTRPSAKNATTPSQKCDHPTTKNETTPSRKNATTPSQKCDHPTTKNETTPSRKNATYNNTGVNTTVNNTGVTPLAPQGEPTDQPPKKKTTSDAGLAERSGLSAKAQKSLLEWFAYKQGQYKQASKQKLVTIFAKQVDAYGDAAVISLVDECIANGWKGITWDKLSRLPEIGRPKQESPPKEAALTPLTDDQLRNLDPRDIF